MNLNKIIRQFPDFMARVEALEAKLESLTATTVDSQPPAVTIPATQVSERPHRRLTLPRKESTIGYPSRAERKAAGSD